MPTNLKSYWILTLFLLSFHVQAIGTQRLLNAFKAVCSIRTSNSTKRLFSFQEGNLTESGKEVIAVIRDHLSPKSPFEIAIYQHIANNSTEFTVRMLRGYSRHSTEGDWRKLNERLSQVSPTYWHSIFLEELRTAQPYFMNSFYSDDIYPYLELAVASERVFFSTSDLSTEDFHYIVGPSNAHDLFIVKGSKETVGLFDERYAMRTSWGDEYPKILDKIELDSSQLKELAESYKDSPLAFITMATILKQSDYLTREMLSFLWDKAAADLTVKNSLDEIFIKHSGHHYSSTAEFKMTELWKLAKALEFEVDDLPVSIQHDELSAMQAARVIQVINSHEGGKSKSYTIVVNGATRTYNGTFEIDPISMNLSGKFSYNSNGGPPLDDYINPVAPIDVTPFAENIEFTRFPKKPFPIPTDLLS